jgi:opacity protein-like surface antigen
MHKITKLLLATSIAALPSMAGVFVGLDYNPSDSISTTSDGLGNDSFDEVMSGYTVSLGIGSVDSRIFEIYYSSQTASDGNIFELPQYYGGTIYSGQDFSEIGITYRPYWEITHHIHWYLDIGISQKTTEISSTSNINLNEDTLNALSVAGGLGLSYNITNRFELNVGYRVSRSDWKRMHYPVDRDYTSDDVEEYASSTTAGMYFGVNIWFGDSGADAYLIKERKEKELDELQKKIDNTF